MDLISHGSSSNSNSIPPSGLTEFEILKATHKFLREGHDDENEKGLSWNEQLAAKYYASLYREFAVCDLKHYKSGNFALRWRTETEVVSGAGETTCGNTRCEHHQPEGDATEDEPPVPKVALTTLELPFAYQEHGELKSALVKVVLCGRCVKKLMWKRNKEKAEQGRGNGKEGTNAAEDDDSLQKQDKHCVSAPGSNRAATDRSRRDSENRRRGDEKRRDSEDEEARRRRSSKRGDRSRSPRRTHHSRSPSGRRKRREHSR